MTNKAQAIYVSVTVKATATNGMRASTNVATGHAFVPATPEPFAYDLDGNLVRDGRWTNTWDGENRLIAMETLATVTSVPRTRLCFTYDSQSRRVRKEVFAWPQGGTNWQVVSDSLYTYDGWNLIREERRPDAQMRRVDIDYVWGSDLSGSLQGAGGIGGLLALQSSLPLGGGTSARVGYACFDGNGNLTDLVGSNGVAVAHYDYSHSVSPLPQRHDVAMVWRWRTMITPPTESRSLQPARQRKSTHSGFRPSTQTTKPPWCITGTDTTRQRWGCG